MTHVCVESRRLEIELHNMRVKYYTYILQDLLDLADRDPEMFYEVIEPYRARLFAIL